MKAEYKVISYDNKSPFGNAYSGQDLEEHLNSYAKEGFFVVETAVIQGHTVVILERAEKENNQTH